MVVVGIVICFCCRYVEDPYGMPTASACPVSWWEMMSNRPEYFPYHKLRSWLEVPRARILISPDSEIIKLNFWGVYPTPTSCAFPQMLHSLGHYPKLLLCPKSPCKINTILLINPSQSLLSLKYHPPVICSLDLHQTELLRVAAITLLASPPVLYCCSH